MPQADRSPFLERAGWGVGFAFGAALLLLVWLARDVVLLGFAAVLLALLLRTPADWVSRRTGIPGGIAVGLVALAATLLIVAVFWLRGADIGAQFTELREQVPSAVERVEAWLRQYGWGRSLVDNVPEPEQLLPESSGVLSQATGVISRTFGVLSTFVIILFLGLVFAIGPRAYTENALRLLPSRRRDRGREILGQLASTLRWWLLGRLISMAFIGVLTGIGLMLLDVPLALILAIIAALLSFIPNIGPLLALAPAFLIGLAQSPGTALAVGALYLGVQVVESYILAPVIDRKTVYLPPAATVLAQLAMALAGGLLGVAVATPLLAATVVLVRTLYVEDVLGDEK